MAATVDILLWLSNKYVTPFPLPEATMLCKTSCTESCGRNRFQTGKAYHHKAPDVITRRNCQWASWELIDGVNDVISIHQSAGSC